MTKKYSKKEKPKQIKEKKKVTRTSKTTKTTKISKTTKKSKNQIQIQKNQNHHKFNIISALAFEDIISKVIPLLEGNYGALSENGDFIIFKINKKKELEVELSFQFVGANLFCQLGNGIFVFNGFNYISFWELKGTKMNKISEYQTIFGLVTYFMEPINQNICAISGPNSAIELIQFNKTKKIPVTYLNYEKSKPKNKKNKTGPQSEEGIGCLFYQKKYSRLLASHFSNILRVWDCDFSKNKFELFKAVKNVTSFTGKIIHELKNKILVGGKDVITILDNNNYEIIEFVNLGNFGYDIFSMEVIKYYNFKEFILCGLRNGKILGVDIEKKKIEFNKKKINDTGKYNELSVKDGKLSFYGENISYITKVQNTNMILVASHDHILKLIEY